MNNPDDYRCYSRQNEPCDGYLGGNCRRCGRLITTTLLEKQRWRREEEMAARHDEGCPMRYHLNAQCLCE